jgi:hypothetical protein
MDDDLVVVNKPASIPVREKMSMVQVSVGLPKVILPNVFLPSVFLPKCRIA